MEILSVLLDCVLLHLLWWRAGGGRKVIRVEVSLNDGKSWVLCDLKHPEEPTKYGKYWCWCFWQIGVDIMDLMKCKEIVVRAWDAAMNTQPQHLTWNVMVRSLHPSQLTRMLHSLSTIYSHFFFTKSQGLGRFYASCNPHFFCHVQVLNSFYEYLGAL
jgi:hypothetical protein